MKRLYELIRAFLAGAAATLIDLAVLALLVSLHVHPRVANIPALLLGGIFSFFANRHVVFVNARSGDAPKQAALYTIVELIALALNALLFDLALRLPFIAGLDVGFSLVVRLVTSHLVFLAWSYPLWRLVFRARPA